MKLPDDLHDVEIASTLDGSHEKSLVYCPAEAEDVPLLVGLHSYAAGDAATIPTWVIFACAGSVALCLVAFFAWGDSGGRQRRSPASA